MKAKKGTTLLEAVIAMFVVAVAIVTLLQALGNGVFGTLDVNRMTSALNLAKSQLENVSAQSYNKSVGNLSNTYGLVTATGSEITDKTNYNISGNVEYVNSSSLQKITVNVSYMSGKTVQLIGFKDEGGSINVSSPYRGMLVTDNIKNVPILYSGSGGSAVECNKVFPGYYHIFNTSGGCASVTWNFEWTRWDSGVTSMGAPIVAIYPGIPSWATRDYLGVAKTDGVIYRQQDRWVWSDDEAWCDLLESIGLSCTIGSIGDLPGPGDGSNNCNCQCTGECVGEANPVWWVPHDCLGAYNDFPCSGGCGAMREDDEYWLYDGGDCALSNIPYYSLIKLDWCFENFCSFCGCNEGTFHRTMKTTNLDPGVYTILFFNSENKINIDTTTAAIAYWK